jgi:hypothetical protein
MPNWISEHGVLGSSPEAVTSEGTGVNVQGLRDRNPSTQGVVRQALLKFGCRNLNFLYRFSKNNLMSNIMKVRRVGTQFCAERRSDTHTHTHTHTHDKANSRFAQFCERTKKHRVFGTYKTVKFLGPSLGIWRVLFYGVWRRVVW